MLQVFPLLYPGKLKILASQPTMETHNVGCWEWSKAGMMESRMRAKARRQWMQVFVLWFLVLAIGPTLVACSRDGAAVQERPARYGPNARQFAINLAEKFPFRSPGSQGEKEAANYVKEAFEKMDYEVRIQPFTYDEAGASHRSQNLVVFVPGTGFKKQINDEQKEADLKTAPSAKAKSPRPSADKGIDHEKNFSAQLQYRSDLDPNNSFIVVGAHYDTPISKEEAQKRTKKDADLLDYRKYNGIHNNAAAVGVLYQLLDLYTRSKPAYDTYIVAFGAGTADCAGAEAFIQSMGNEIDACVGMYNLACIYAGNKVYAHAGVNSIEDAHDKNYMLRRKLYEVTDVYYDNLLLTNNDFAIYTNQSVYSLPNPQREQDPPVPFREWTTHLSDHRPFDRRGIPVVFFESYEYNVDKYTELVRESTDPVFASYGGNISGNPIDSTSFLLSHFQSVDEEERQEGQEAKESRAEARETRPSGPLTPEASLAAERLKEDKRIDLLERRINNLAFVIFEALKKPPIGYDLRR